MATADAEQEFASTPQWFLWLMASFLAGFLMFGIAVIAGSVASYLLLSHFIPVAVPFHWLAVFGIVLTFVLHDPTAEEVKGIESLTDPLDELEGRAIWVYFGTIMLIFIGLVSFLTAVVAIASLLAAQSTSIGAGAIMLAIWYPAIDHRLGRTLGINVASLGALGAIGLMYVVAILWRVPTAVPSQAANDFRASLGLRVYSPNVPSTNKRTVADAQTRLNESPPTR